MDRKSKAIFYLLLPAVLFFFLGFCIGSTSYHELLKGVTWTNIVSSTVSVLGFSLAFLTYNQWLTNKQNDDSYLIAKNYITALKTIEDSLRAISFEYFHLCPAPGAIAASKEIATKRIQNLHELSSSLYSARFELNDSKRELAFWKVKLSDSFNQKHDSLNKGLNDINVIVRCLNNQLYHYYLQEDENIEEVLRHKNMFDQSMNSVTEILNERVSLGFEKVFKFE